MGSNCRSPKQLKPYYHSHLPPTKSSHDLPPVHFSLWLKFIFHNLQVMNLWFLSLIIILISPIFWASMRRRSWDPKRRGGKGIGQTHGVHSVPFARLCSRGLGPGWVFGLLHYYWCCTWSLVKHLVDWRREREWLFNRRHQPPMCHFCEHKGRFPDRNWVLVDHGVNFHSAQAY